MPDGDGPIVGCFLVGESLGGISDGYEAFVSGPRYMKREAVIRYPRKHDKSITLKGQRWSAVGGTPDSSVARAEAEKRVERLTVTAWTLFTAIYLLADGVIWWQIVFGSHGGADSSTARDATDSERETPSSDSSPTSTLLPSTKGRWLGALLVSAPVTFLLVLVFFWIALSQLPW